MRMSVALTGMLKVMTRTMLVMAMTTVQTHTYVCRNGSMCVWMYICMYVGMTVYVCVLVGLCKHVCTDACTKMKIEMTMRM